MQLSKNALGNLINRYKAVLKKCHVLNTFGSLAMAAMLCLGLSGGLALELGSPQGALAATVTDTSNDGSATNASGGNDTVNTDQSGNNAFGGQAKTTNSTDGGDSQSATANGNTLNITNGGTVTNAHGGSAQSLGGDIVNNEGNGGTAGAATANENILSIEVGGTVGGNAYAGYAYSNGGGVYYDDGTGGTAGTASVKNNEISISGTVKNTAYGGFAESRGGNIDGGNGNGGDAGTTIATYNSMTVEVDGTVDGDAYAGYAYSYGGDVYYAINHGGDAATATATHNSLIMRGTVSSSAYGGYAYSRGGDAVSGTAGNADIATATHNSLIIRGTVSFSAYGGYAYSRGGDVVAGTAGSAGVATASYNTVLIEGATLGTAGHPDTGHIIGGVADGNGDSRAENNTVTLLDAVTFHKSDSFVVGGLVHYPGYGFDADPRAFNGNTLNVERYTGDKIGTLGNFETYNFIVGDNTLLEVGTLHLSNGAIGADAKSASIGTIVTDITSPLEEGNAILLIEYDTVVGTLANDGDIVKAQQGAFLDMTATIHQDNTAITATLGTPQANANASGVMGARTAGMGQVILNMEHSTDGTASSAQGAIDIALGKEKSINAGSELVREQKAFTTFGTISGGTMSYDVGDGLDVYSLSFVSGLAYGYKHEGGNLLLAAFFEGSLGSFDTHNTEIDGSSIKGNGDSNTYGFGLLARYDFYTDFGTPYIEGSFHYGQVRSEYQSDDITDPVTRETASFENTNNYTAFHLGLGYIWDINKNSKLDLYAKYYYIHQDADDFTILDSTFAMDSITSQRLRFGAEYSYDIILQDESIFELSLGLAYEYEFDGHMGGTVLDVALADESLQGSTYIGEIAIKYSPSAIEGLTFSLGVQGYLGEREGVVGSVGVQYSF